MKRFYYLLVFALIFTVAYPQAKAPELSHYLFPDFTKGTILLKNGTRNMAFLNYNSLTEEMVFKDRDRMLALKSAELQHIDTVFIRDRKFFTLDNKFVELILHSTCDLYAEHKCKLIPPGKPGAYGTTSQTSSSVTYSSLSSEGGVYALKLPDDYKIDPYTYYWLKRNGELTKFTNSKQLMKLYDDKADVCKAYVKKQDVKYTNQESIVQFIQYMETH
jgi:hypothetical protein